MWREVRPGKRVQGGGNGTCEGSAVFTSFSSPPRGLRNAFSTSEYFKNWVMYGRACGPPVLLHLVLLQAADPSVGIISKRRSGKASLPSILSNVDRLANHFDELLAACVSNYREGSHHPASCGCFISTHFLATSTNFLPHSSTLPTKHANHNRRWHQC